MDWEALEVADHEVAQAIPGELDRERSTIRLIASENYTSRSSWPPSPTP